MTEVWLRVPMAPYRNYEVSNLGNVRRGGHKLAPVLGADGYHSVRLYYSGLGKRFRINRLVCEAFHGTPFDGAHAAHIDGDRHNNSADNLRWATAKANAADKAAHGTHQSGEAHPRARLTIADIQAIRASAKKRSEIAAEFGISYWHVKEIRARRKWKDASAVPEGDLPNTIKDQHHDQ